MDNIENMKRKYLRELESQLEVDHEDLRLNVDTKDYDTFRKETLPARAGLFEKLCNSFSSVISFEPPAKQKEAIQKSLDMAHLRCTPAGVYTVAYSIPLMLLFTSITVFGLIPMLFLDGLSLFYLLLSIILSMILIIPFLQYPKYIATIMRQKASNEMVLCIFYIVTYMRQSSNLERAIEFAADHLDPPLSLDLKRLIWNVETETNNTLKDALDEYLKTWKGDNDEFIDSIHLIESSLLESSEARRLDLLDKSLDVMLDGTYENMLHYAQNLKNPITMLHMLGVILPILGLVILPLAVSFMEGIKWTHLAVFYNIILPLGIFLLSKKILASRPSGYGSADISDSRNGLKKYKGFLVNLGFKKVSIPSSFIAISIISVFFIIGLLPILIFAGGGQDICWDFGNVPLTCSELEQQTCKMTYCTWGYRLEDPETKSSIPIVDPNDSYVTAGKQSGKNIVGPYGLIASLLSVALPIGLGLGIGIYYKLRSKKVMKVREETKKLEKEFSTALFQLGNRLGDGVPAEVAIPKVAMIMDGTVSGNFFAQVANNMQKMGMGLTAAIFDKKQGAINYYPSKILESSMKVLVESTKKGPIVAAQAINNIARYIKEIHRVDERLKDLLSDIISSMKQQIGFLAPMISGVVVGITSMITFILIQLQSTTQQFSQDVGPGQGLDNLIQLGSGIPTYYFQLFVGIYVVQIVFILTIMSNTIENGDDKLAEEFSLGKNMVKSTLIYCILAFILMAVFQLVTGQILKL